MVGENHDKSLVNTPWSPYGRVNLTLQGKSARK